MCERMQHQDICIDASVLFAGHHTHTQLMLQASKLKKPKKAEPVVEVQLPDLSGSHFELPAMVRRREEAPISSGDDVKLKVIDVFPSTTTPSTPQRRRHQSRT